ncbi:fatty acid desaturase [Hypoxylon sp. FL1284]|nr:fatty acid desaturase [Hypoxylon sp. FL1284]
MAAKTYPLLSRRQIEGMIAEGRSIFIVNQYVLKADPWLKYHPGGDKAILHMVGRDATDEVNALHSLEARQQMNRYRIGRIEGRWANFIPPIQGGKFRPLLDDEQDDRVDDASEECDPSSTESSSVLGSRDPSPVFDSAQPTIRNRRAADGVLPSAASTPSVSSVEPDGDGMSYLDTVTKEKTTLDLEKYPSLDFDTQDAIVAKYHELARRMEAEGFYHCNYWAYAIEGTRYSMLFGLSFLFLHWGWYITSAMCLGAVWHQMVFTAHDAGHMGITHNFHGDTVIGIIIADFLGGLSLGWWKRNHNVHHIVTNAPEHDPDIEHMPFLAVSHRFFGNMRSTYYDRVMEYDAVAKVMLRVQHYTYYLLLLFGRLNLYRLSWDYLLMGRGPRKGPAMWHRWLEIAGHVFFWAWYGYGVLYKSIPDNSTRLVYFLISHIVPMPVHAQICLSHFAMSTSDLGPHESFPQKMLRTTMDIDCPQWLDFFHGGLQFQVIHHLFPRMPRHNLRRAQKLVQEFCNEIGIPYALYGFVDGNKQVVGTLAEVSRQAAILAKCQKVLAESEDPIHGHHH